MLQSAGETNCYVWRCLVIFLLEFNSVFISSEVNDIYLLKDTSYYHTFTAKLNKLFLSFSCRVFVFFSYLSRLPDTAGSDNLVTGHSTNSVTGFFRLFVTRRKRLFFLSHSSQINSILKLHSCFIISFKV